MTTSMAVNQLVGGPTVECQIPGTDRLNGPLSSGSEDSEELTRAKGVFRGWSVVLQHHRCPRVVIDDARSQVLEYLTVPSESLFFKRAKYLGPMIFAWYLRVALPEAPGEPFHMRRSFRRWAKSRRFVNRRNTHLWYSILQGKRAAYPLSEDMVQKTYQSHREAMEGEDPLDEDLLEDIMRLLEPVLKQVSVRLWESYQTDDDVDHLSESSWFPSRSASYEASRGQGGQQREVFRVITDHHSGTETKSLAELAKLERKAWAESAEIDFSEVKNPEEVGDSAADLDRAESFNSLPRKGIRDYVEELSKVRDSISAFEDLRGPELVRMAFYPRVMVNGRVRTNVVVEFYDEPDAGLAWDECLSDTLLLHDTGRPLKCMIYGILEPLKVRVISKGESLPYYGSKELQKRLHGILRTMPCFRLIGRPLCPTDLYDCANNPVGGDPNVCEWFSVDYSSATDCLSAGLSRRILCRVVEHLPKRMQDIWLRVLAPHWCEYPTFRVENPEVEEHERDCRFCASGLCNKRMEIRDTVDATVKPVLQRNGQLMGSPLSFPILCLANLGVYLATISDDPRGLRSKLNGVLVNGDDMLYAAPHRYWERHEEIGLRVGLKMTVGKAYYHPVVANANSTCMHMDLTRFVKGDFSSAHPCQISFLNTGLYFAQQKVLGKVDTGEEAADGTCSQLINELLKGTLPGRQCEVLGRYLVLHKDEISQECKGRNLFIPASLGGMDQVAPLGWKFRITNRQKSDAVARSLPLGPFACFGQGPLPSLGLDEVIAAPQRYAPVDTEPKETIHGRDKFPGITIKRRLMLGGVRAVRHPMKGWKRSFVGEIENRPRPRFIVSVGHTKGPTYTEALDAEISTYQEYL